MKPFNLEEAKAGKPVQTRDGRKARIVCFDAQDRDNKKYIVALVTDLNAVTEHINSYDLNGAWWPGSNSPEDLIMAPVEYNESIL